MEMTFSWIIYSCLIFGSGILCDRHFERREVSFEYPGGKFNCANGETIDKLKVCDGHTDCSDNSDETVLCKVTNTDCGKVYVDQKRSYNGERAFPGTAPWNAGIYRLSASDSNYELICGGSIISSNLVISAARCFLESSKSSNRILKDNGKYKIGVGKYYRSISDLDNIYTQIMHVDTIYMKDTFYGVSGFYAEDVAIVTLKGKITFSNYVTPICIDWNGKYSVANDDQGKIFGWGSPSTGIISNVLLELSLPYIDHRTCRNLYNNGFEVYVTSDKFCAGSELVAGKGVDVGYAGAGLTFLHSNSYYLTGITNVKDTESNNSIALFTEVNYHLRWIREIYDSHKL